MGRRGSRQSGQPATVEAFAKLLDEGPLPELVVFDLDYTCWSCYIDALSGPPFTYSPTGRSVSDGRGSEVELFPDVRPMLLSLISAGCKIAYASRTDEPDWANQVLSMYMVDDMRNMDDIAHAKEIYPGSKVTHFRRFQDKTDIPFECMLFFDDERRNIDDVSRLGVTCYHCAMGMSYDAFAEGLSAWRASSEK